jgi:hypothetical protein
MGLSDLKLFVEVLIHLIFYLDIQSACDHSSVLLLHSMCDVSEEKEVWIDELFFNIDHELGDSVVVQSLISHILVYLSTA